MNHLAVFGSDNGGWAERDQEIGPGIAGRGIPVVVVNSLKYFWTNRTPEQTTKDRAPSSHRSVFIG